VAAVAFFAVFVSVTLKQAGRDTESAFAQLWLGVIIAVLNIGKVIIKQNWWSRWRSSSSDIEMMGVSPKSEKSE
jgi:integral membrane sensor domain MASE1